ncbi:MAG: beta-propeller domain-containing protein [Candidatus Peribacteraceae bacterium]
MRVSLSLLTLTAITATLVPPLAPVHAVAFSDVSGSTEYHDAIQSLESKGVIQGNPDGTFRSTAFVNRAELLKILLESRGTVESEDGSHCFPDVRDEWFAGYVCAAEEEGIIDGYPDGMFRPEKPVTFVEAAKIFSNAYDQELGTGSEWYEPFARALDSSKAIPPSIEKLDAPLTRGEMAEMMWRLSEGKTDQDSKGYLNVKYPDMKVDLSSDAPQKLTSCTDLKAFTDEAGMGGGGYPMPLGFAREMPAMMDMAVNDGAAVTKSESSGTTGGDYSHTNIQVEGVDEGDIVKTDGQYVYALSRNDGKVRIVDIRDAKNPKVVSTVSIDNFYGSEVYVAGSTLVLIGTISVPYDGGVYPMPLGEGPADQKMAMSMIYPPIYQTQKTTALFFDVSTKSKPVEKRRVSIEGNRISTRVSDGALLLVLQTSPRWWGPYVQSKTARAEGLLPVFDDSAKRIEDSPVVGCNDVTVLPRVPRPQYLIVASVPLTGTGDVQREVILGDATQVYVSSDNLYIAATEWQYWWGSRGMPPSEKTHLYRFSYSPSSVEFRAHGTVPGHLLNQFSMDEMNSNFRVATTIGEQWGVDDRTSVSRNNVFVLNSSLETVGSIENIAPGETIYSARFLGNRAYMVTFKKIDPFFVLDLSNPRDPKVLGALKIPGYSDYLHPYDENHIIGFGKDAVDSGKEDFAWYQGMKIALFDVSDVENPKEKFKTIIGDRGTQSPLLYDHKALLFDKERGLLAFPVQVLELTAEQKAKPDDGSAYGSPVFQGAYIYDLSLSKGFTLRGKISHYEEEDFIKSGSSWYGYGKDIERIVRIGSSLFTVSEGMLKANELESLNPQGSVKLAEQTNGGIVY